MFLLPLILPMLSSNIQLPQMQLSSKIKFSSHFSRLPPEIRPSVVLRAVTPCISRVESMSHVPSEILYEFNPRYTIIRFVSGEVAACRTIFHRCQLFFPLLMPCKVG